MAAHRDISGRQARIRSPSATLHSSTGPVTMVPEIGVLARFPMVSVEPPLSYPPAKGATRGAEGAGCRPPSHSCPENISLIAATGRRHRLTDLDLPARGLRLAAEHAEHAPL